MRFNVSGRIVTNERLEAEGALYNTSNPYYQQQLEQQQQQRPVSPFASRQQPEQQQTQQRQPSRSKSTPIPKQSSSSLQETLEEAGKSLMKRWSSVYNSQSSSSNNDGNNNNAETNASGKQSTNDIKTQNGASVEKNNRTRQAQLSVDGGEAETATATTDNDDPSQDDACGRLLEDFQPRRSAVQSFPSTSTTTTTTDTDPHQRPILSPSKTRATTSPRTLRRSIHMLGYKEQQPEELLQSIQQDWQSDSEVDNADNNNNNSNSNSNISSRIALRDKGLISSTAAATATATTNSTTIAVTGETTKTNETEAKKPLLSPRQKRQTKIRNWAKLDAQPLSNTEIPMSLLASQRAPKPAEGRHKSVEELFPKRKDEQTVATGGDDNSTMVKGLLVLAPNREGSIRRMMKSPKSSKRDKITRQRDSKPKARVRPRARGAAATAADAREGNKEDNQEDNNGDIVKGLPPPPLQISFPTPKPPLLPKQETVNADDKRNTKPKALEPPSLPSFAKAQRSLSPPRSRRPTSPQRTKRTTSSSRPKASPKTKGGRRTLAKESSNVELLFPKKKERQDGHQQGDDILSGLLVLAPDRERSLRSLIEKPRRSAPSPAPTLPSHAE